MKTSAFILSLLFFCLKANAQDSFYLVGTISGESTSKAITNVSGIGDVNGDGYDDFIVTHYFNKSADLYLGGTALDLVPDITFYYPNNGDSVRYFGIGTGIGDVNGDGYNDFTITGTFLNDGYYPKGKVFLYYGGLKITGEPVCEYSGPGIEDGFGDTYKMGDINKDSFDDFMICSHYNWSDGLGYAYLFLGGDNISIDNSITFSTGNPEDHFGVCAANIGDINKDGYDDIAISLIPTMIEEDTIDVFIYYGNDSIDNVADTNIVSYNNYDGFSNKLKNAGDLDNNGKVNFLAGSISRILFYEGLTVSKTIDINSFGIGGYTYFDTNFDLNNDGYKDFVIGNTNHRDPDSTMTGGIFVFLGTIQLDTIYSFHKDGETKWSEFSKIISHGDMNGDGYDELIVLAPNFPDSENPIGKIYIYTLIKPIDDVDRIDNKPLSFRLLHNYPNPFNPATSISFQLSKLNQITLKIFDILGKEVCTLINEEKTAGMYIVEFDAAEYNLSSGIYFCELKVNGGESKRIKMTLLK